MPYGLNSNITNVIAEFGKNDFTDKVSSLKPAYLRIPGGKPADSWDWKTMKPSLQSVSYIQKLCGCTIVFVLNLNHELKDQINMLKVAKGLGIPFVCEFGNEISNESNQLLKRFNSSGVEYGKLYKRWADTIKQFFPETKVIAWGESKSYLPNWTSELLSVCTPDALSSHLYPLSETISIGGMIDDDRLRQRIDGSFKTAGIDFSVEICITECNLAPINLGMLQKGQHRHAIVTMCEYFTSKRIKVICINNIYGRDNGAFTINKFGKAVITPTGRALAKLNNINIEV